MSSVNVDSTKAIHTVSDRYISFTLDTSKVRVAEKHDGVFQDPNNLTSPAFIALASHFGPSYLRFGGTSEDALTYDMSAETNGSLSAPGKTIPNGTLTRKMWDGINTFCAAVGWEVVMGLNLLTNVSASSRLAGGWDATNARSLLEYTKSKGYNVVGYELGNENNLNNKALAKMYDPDLYGAGFATLRSLIVDVYGGVGNGTKSSPWVIGPDTTKGTTAVAYATSVLSSTLAHDVPLNAVTWHHYYLAGAGSKTNASAFATVEYLNSFSAYAAEYAAVFQAYVANASSSFSSSPSSSSTSSIQLWLGETGGAGGATATADQVTGKFLGCFWWADKLGTAAVTGHHVVARQDWTELVQQVGKNQDASIVVAPSFWVALLWKTLVGRDVLAIDASSYSNELLPTNASRTGSTRYYAFDSKTTATSQAGNGVVVVVVNLAKEAHTLPLSIDGVAAGSAAAWKQYSLTAGGSSLSTTDIHLNGRKLAVGDGGAIPAGALAPANMSKGSKVEVPALSVSFLVF
jgi:heparanase 1